MMFSTLNTTSSYFMTYLINFRWKLLNHYHFENIPKDRNHAMILYIGECNIRRWPTFRKELYALLVLELVLDVQISPLN
jgi:hypothetical protein